MTSVFVLLPPKKKDGERVKEDGGWGGGVEAFSLMK